MTRSEHPTIAIIVHGGAGNIPDAYHAPAEAGCRAAANIGWQVLEQGGSALDAVEAAVQALENNPTFNAGHGSVLNRAGRIEMDAGIMDGATKRVGAVTLIEHFSHPISIARKVMEKTPHHILGAAGAEAFARAQGFVPIKNEALITERRLKQYYEHSQAMGGDTVGAVALDAAGNLATANSTGGISFKMPGRIGDSPIPGAGFYADNLFGAVATTGQGEHIMRAGLAFLVMRQLELGASAIDAARQAEALFLARVPKGGAGWIVLDSKGDIGIWHTTSHLSHAYRRSGMKDVASGLSKQPAEPTDVK